MGDISRCRGKAQVKKMSTGGSVKARPKARKMAVGGQVQAMAPQMPMPQVLPGQGPVASPSPIAGPPAMARPMNRFSKGGKVKGGC